MVLTVTEPKNVFPAKYKVELEYVEDVLYYMFSAVTNKNWAAQASLEITDYGYVPIHWRHIFGDKRSDHVNAFLKEVKEE